MNTDKGSAARGLPDGGFNDIHLAARKRNISSIERLIKSGVDPNLRNRVEENGDGGNTPLWFAAQGPNGLPAVAKILVDAGADVNAVCEHGTTAAHMACSWGHTELLRYLHASGADLSIGDLDGSTAEMFAREGCPWQLVKISAEQRAGVIGFFDALT